MTYRTVTSLFICLSFIIACSNQHNEMTMKEQLIEKLINHPEVKPLNSSGQILVLKSNNCNGMDCKIYFQKYANQIKVLSKENLFMMGIKEHIEIEHIDSVNGKIFLKTKYRSGSKNIELNL